MMVKSGLEFFILKFTKPLQSCCCPVQKYPPRMAELAWQLSRYLWRGSVNFKINSRPLFTIIFKLKNDNFKTRDFSPLIERVLAGVIYYLESKNSAQPTWLTLKFAPTSKPIKNPLKPQPIFPTVAWSLGQYSVYNFVAPLVKKCQNRIFTPVQYALYTPKFIGLWKNT